MNDARNDQSSMIVEDHELAARAANALLWRRRAVVLSLVVLFVSPITAAAVLWMRHSTRMRIDYNPPGPDVYVVREAYIQYMREEGPSRRGTYFVHCALMLFQQIRAPGQRAITEDNLLYHLGPSDEVIQTTAGTDYVYRYRQAGTPNAHIVASVTVVNGKRVFSAMDFRSDNTAIPATSPTGAPR